MHKTRIIPRKGLMISACLLTLVVGLLAGSTAILGVKGGNSVGSSLMLVYIWLGIPITYIADPHRTGFNWITLSASGVEYHAIFRRKRVQPYSAYPYWAHGQYIYEGIMPMHFLVLSDRKLTTKELYEVNKIQPSARLLKIKMTKNNFKNLMDVLPEKQRSTLIGLFPDLKKELYNNIE